MKVIALALLAAAALVAQTPPAHPAWSGDQVHVIKIQFKQADYWQQLVKNYEGTEVSAPYLEGSLEWGKYKFASVGVRFKGNSSYNGARTKKKPFRIKLNEFVKGQKIEGIGAFNLSNLLNDPSMVREPLYYELAGALGLKAPRTNYAALYINNEYFGLYLLGEVLNSDFLKNYFGSKEDTGNLYKGNIGASFAYLGENKTTYKSVWEKQTNEEADDWTDLIELCRIIDQTPAAELKAKLEPIFDIDSFLTAMALDNATVNLDSYVGLGQNFNVYRRPSDKRWVWLVWDPSLSFAALSIGAGGQSAPLTQLATEYVQAGGAGGAPPPGGGVPPGGVPPGGGLPPGGVPPGGGGFPGGGLGGSATRPLATKLWEIPEYKQRYRQIYKDIVTRVFNRDKVITRANELRTMIRPWVRIDTQLLVTQDAFDQAMTAPIPQATDPAGGGVPPGGVPPGGGAPPGGPGGGGGGLSGNVVGLQTLVEGRLAWLKEQFAPQSFPNATLTSSTTTLNLTSAATQHVDLRYTGVGTPPTWSLIARTDNGGSWLTPSITGGAFPGSFDLTISSKDLSRGFYSGSVSIYLGGSAAVTIPVNLTIGTLTAPSLSSVVNGASYSNLAVAPQEIVTLFGSNLSTPGLKVTFDGEAAQLIYVSDTQLGAVVPSAVSGKAQTFVQGSYGTLNSPAFSKLVRRTNPGIFTLNASGTGLGAIVNQNSTVNGTQNPAPKGSIVAVYITGGGLELATSTTAAQIGNQAADVVYAGPAPGGGIGLQQVNVRIPANATSGVQTVTITAGGVPSQSGVTIQVQ